MWYSTAIMPEERIKMTASGRASIIVYRRNFAAHVVYYEGKVTSHYAPIANVPLVEFDSWCVAPKIGVI